jgi:hypothetical protein
MSLYRLLSVRVESVYHDPREILLRRHTKNMLPRRGIVNVLFLYIVKLCPARLYDAV